MSDKGRDSPDFNESDVQLFLKIISKYKTIVENKDTDTLSMQAKRLCWKRIEKEFNAISFTQKTVQGLRSMWENMKSEALKISENQPPPKRNSVNKQPNLEKATVPHQKKQQGASEVSPEALTCNLPATSTSTRNGRWSEFNSVNGTKPQKPLKTRDRMELVLSILHGSEDPLTIEHQTVEDKTPLTYNISDDSNDDDSVVIDDNCQSVDITYIDDISSASTPPLVEEHMPSSSSGPTPAKRKNLENGCGSPHAGCEIISNNRITEAVKCSGPSVDTCLQFLSSLLKEIKSEKLRLETMDLLVQTVINARKMDLDYDPKS